MRSIENISEIEMNNNTYNVIDCITLNNNNYLFLENKKDKEDMMCLKATLEDELKLSRLDTEEELISVTKKYCEKYGLEFQN